MWCRCCLRQAGLKARSACLLARTQLLREQLQGAACAARAEAVSRCGLSAQLPRLAAQALPGVLVHQAAQRAKAVPSCADRLAALPDLKAILAPATSRQSAQQLAQKLNTRRPATLGSLQVVDLEPQQQASGVEQAGSLALWASVLQGGLWARNCASARDQAAQARSVCRSWLAGWSGGAPLRDLHGCQPAEPVWCSQSRQRRARR